MHLSPVGTALLEGKVEPEALAGPADPPPASGPYDPLRRAFWRFRGLFLRYGYWIAVFAAFYFWIAVIIDGHLNASWWSFTQNSFSALGDPDPGNATTLAWFYNDVVVIPTGLMLMVFSAAMVGISRNKIQETGSAFFIVAGIFLMVIGIDHAGTPYHDFVSEWFFVQADFSIFLWGFGLLWERRWTLTGTTLALAIGAPIAASVWAHAAHLSVAEVEAIGIIAIDLWAMIMYFARRPARPA